MTRGTITGIKCVLKARESVHAAEIQKLDAEFEAKLSDVTSIIGNLEATGSSDARGKAYDEVVTELFEGTNVKDSKAYKAGHNGVGWVELMYNHYVQGW